MKHIKTISITAILIVLAGAGIYILQQKSPPAPEADTPAQTAQQDPSIEKQFEDLLNEFLSDVNTRAKAYREERKVMAEVVKPENLTTPDYVTQNYEMMQQTMPSLRLKINEIMLVFEDADRRVKALLEGQLPEFQERILAEWKNLKDSQAGLYVDFFAIEEEILQAYEDLMAFYNDKKDAFTIDPATFEMSFTEPADAQAAADIRVRLQELAARQAALLDSGGAE